MIFFVSCLELQPAVNNPGQSRAQLKVDLLVAVAEGASGPGGAVDNCAGELSILPGEIHFEPAAGAKALH